MKLSPKKQPKFIQFKSLPPYDNDTGLSLAEDEEFWPMMGIVFAIWGAWTGIIHFIDWLTFDAVPWWAEPFTVAPAIFIMAMNEKYNSFNPLLWWPTFWGYKAKLPDEDKIMIRPLDIDRIVKQYGGPLNVYIMDYEHIKFRRKKDAVMFGLRYF